MTSSGYQDRKFIVASILVAAFVLFELFIAAERFNNWRGFFISALHTIVVLVGTLLATRNK